MYPVGTTEKWLKVFHSNSFLFPLFQSSAKNGRSISIHPDEALLSELREKQLTPQGRKRLRERVTVEHSLAHIGQWQGEKARYLGLRKNLFDLRRMAIVHNLHVVMRSNFEERLRGGLLRRTRCRRRPPTFQPSVKGTRDDLEKQSPVS